MAITWRLRPHDRDQIAALSQAAKLQPLVAHLLLNRGVTDAESAIIFLAARRDNLHDPELLSGVVEASERIVSAIRAGKKIVVYGDYDVDGVCGTSILWTCLKLAGAKDAEYHIPHRIEDGYGVTAKGLKRVVEEKGAQLVVSVDCGVTAVEEAKLARQLGVEFIVTDHHTPGASWPEADAVVHPLAPGGAYPFPELCGAGVAFKLAWQICKSFGDGKKSSPHLREFLLHAMNLVALATVADVVPLEGENRIFVRHGLRGLAATQSPGLKALLQISGLWGREKLNAGNVGFNIGPRINAAGRLQYAMQAVELLTTDDEARANEIAQALDACNRERQEVEHLLVTEAHEAIKASGGLGERGAVVLGGQNWHAGVIGIVASRLVDTYHRPAILISIGEELAQGSARSVPGFDLYEAIKACSDGLDSFGGHRMAAGIKLKSSFVPIFAERFDQYCRANLSHELRRKELWIDAEVNLNMLTPSVVNAIEELEPHGTGNPKPLLLAERTTIVGEPRVVGEKKNHLQMRFAQGDFLLKAIGWGLAGKASEWKAGTPCSVVFSPSINEWNGRREVQLEVRDLRVSSSQDERHAVSV